VTTSAKKDKGKHTNPQAKLKKAIDSADETSLQGQYLLVKKGAEQTPANESNNYHLLFCKTV
jgi:hypothetical protein